MPLQLSASSPVWFRMISICFGFLSCRYATFQSVAAYLRKSQHRLLPGFSDRLDMELRKQTTTFCYVFLLDYHGLSTYFVEFVFFYIMFWTKIHRMTVLGTCPQQKQAVFYGRRHCCALVAVTIAEAIGKARCVEGLRGNPMDPYGEYRSFQQNEYHAIRLVPLKSPKYPKSYNLSVVGM